VLEAAPRAGGRASSFFDRTTGDAVDNGQHVLVGCYRETLRFLARIAARDAVRFQVGLEVPFVLEDGRSSVLRAPELPPPLNLLAGLFEWDALTTADRVAALRTAPALRAARRDLRAGRQRSASDAETVEEWLVRIGQTRRLRALLWEPLALAALNQSPRVAAAPTFVRVLAEMFGGGAHAASIGIPAVPLSDLYVSPSIRYLEGTGCEVRTGSPARLLMDGARAGGVEVGGAPIAARAVIAAVPWHALPKVVAAAADPGTGPLAAVAERAAAMRSSPIVGINLWLSRPAFGRPFVGLPGRTCQWVFERPGDGGGAHLTFVSSGADAVLRRTNDELVALARDELFGAAPDARRAAVRHALVVRESRATFSLAPGEPARPSTRTPVAGFFLAGDWIDTGLPGTIESAVVSGHRAADAVVEDLEGQP
jgi:squalene-associated FAD-dependent desaturase